jgi:hypothetical protein
MDHFVPLQHASAAPAAAMCGATARKATAKAGGKKLAKVAAAAAALLPFAQDENGERAASGSGDGGRAGAAAADKDVDLKKGAWTVEEDAALRHYIQVREREKARLRCEGGGGHTCGVARAR